MTPPRRGVRSPQAGWRLLPGRLGCELPADVDKNDRIPGGHFGCHALAVSRAAFFAIDERTQLATLLADYAASRIQRAAFFNRGLFAGHHLDLVGAGRTGHQAGDHDPPVQSAHHEAVSTARGTSPQSESGSGHRALTRDSTRFLSTG